jgi:hypothetical protein
VKIIPVPGQLGGSSSIVMEVGKHLEVQDNMGAIAK